MAIQPPHSGVDDRVEIGQSSILPHADAPPNDWLYSKKFNPEHDIPRIRGWLRQLRGRMDTTTERHASSLPDIRHREQVMSGMG
ncbi:hypothetical protein ACFOLD_12260 [Kocuria carniphila]|uniref:hypothetical protein n=1 Tax=Kocuria carniphila TaxID=262208 RepID=UPI00361A2467